MARSAVTARKAKSGGPRKNLGQKGTPAKKGSQAKQGKGQVGKGSNKKKVAPKTGARRSARARQETRKPATAEELEAEMDEYWLKSENKEVAAKKLDEEMDSYWEKKNAAKEVEHVVEEEDAVEEKPEAS